MWNSLTLKKKNIIFSTVVMSVVLLSMALNLWLVNFCVNDFRKGLEGNAQSSAFMDAIETESRLFLNYIKEPLEENRKELGEACADTEAAAAQLPFDYNEMSEKRYAKTWSVRNSFAEYCRVRDQVIEAAEQGMSASPDQIDRLYQVYDMQKYLQDYAGKLMRYTLEDENAMFQKRVRLIRLIPVFLIVLGCIMVLVVEYMFVLVQRTLIHPLLRLIEAVRRIAANDLFVEDVQIDSLDEMGELARAFNDMKHVTREYIMALEEKRDTLNLLHQEEMKRLTLEQKVKDIRLELLKSQMDPHFLFNTLNVISGMANLEDAATTEKMIKSLSALFRYNLKNVGPKVELRQELKIVQDYMYLQQMRFGDRISYRVSSQEDVMEALVPSFFFQPLVENAIVHGLAPKEEGGAVEIDIRRREIFLDITITDTGVGIEAGKLQRIRESMQAGEYVGIGLGNIYQRIFAMYDNSEMEIDSTQGTGTRISIQIPLQSWEDEH